MESRILATCVSESLCHKCTTQNRSQRYPFLPVVLYSQVNYVTPWPRTGPFESASVTRSHVAGYKRDAPWNTLLMGEHEAFARSHRSELNKREVRESNEFLELLACLLTFTKLFLTKLTADLRDPRGIRSSSWDWIFGGGFYFDPARIKILRIRHEVIVSGPELGWGVRIG